MIIKTYESGQNFWKDISIYPIIHPKGSFHLIGKEKAISLTNLITIDDISDLRIDLSHIGFTSIRWTSFLTKYIDCEAYDEWMEKALAIGRREPLETLLDFHRVQRYHRKHSGGNCMIGMSFRGGHEPTLTLYSRISMLPTTGSLELIFAHLVHKELISQYPSVRFIWFVSTLWWRFIDVFPLVSFQRPGLVRRSDILRYQKTRWFSADRDLKYMPCIRAYDTYLKLRLGKNKSVISSNLKIHY